VCRLFPDACFIYVKRSPGDNLNSLIEGWGKPEEFATWSDDLPAKVAIDGGKYTRWCFFLAKGWQDLITASIEDVCAFQYQAINQAILAAKITIPPSQWYEVAYEDLIQDPVAQFGRMFNACELDFDERLRKHCENVLNIPYNAFSEIRLDKWRDGRNRDKVEHVIPCLSRVASDMGYSC